MAAPNKKSIVTKMLNKFQKLGKKKNVAEVQFTEVGIPKENYTPHDPSNYVTLKHVKNWKEYAAYLTNSDESSLNTYEVNAVLNEKISLWFGDITRLQIDAIVNSASPDLLNLGDVGHEIHTRAGPELSTKCAAIGHCPVGEAKLTKGFKLPAKYVIHTVAPRGGDRKHASILKSCYRNSLEVAKHNKIRTIAFPCLGTLFCGFDIELATPIAVSTVREWILERDNKTHIDRIIFSVIVNSQIPVYEQNLLRFFPAEHPKTVPYEISQDPYALSLYEQAIKEGKERDKVIRVNIVGNFGQGKTTLKRRLVGQKVDDVESTNSIEINRHTFTLTEDGRVSCKDEGEGEDHEILDRIVAVARKTEFENSLEAKKDIPYDEVDARFVPPEPGTIEQTVAKSVIYNRTDESATISDVDQRQTTPNAGENSNPKELFSSEENSNTKEFLEPAPHDFKRALSEQELITFSRQLKISNKEESNCKAIIDFWDFGGQYVFYATHTMFHSRQAIYLLVFDLTKDLSHIVKDEEFPGDTGDKNMEYFARFWMNSIHSFVGNKDGSLPVVILVGTHKDKIGTLIKSDETEEDYCDEYFEKVRQLFEGTKVFNHIDEKDFAVDNSDPSNGAVAELLDEILRKGEELSKMVEIPARWLPLEQALKMIKSDEKIIRFQRLREIDENNEFSLTDSDQLKLFLRYHHGKGTLFYFDEESISDYVVLDPKYVIDAFKCIITSERFCRKSVLRDSWNKLIREGTLEDVLIERVWRNDKKSNFIEHKQVLLEFLKKHHIISEAKEFDENSGTAKVLGWYIVPSLLKDHSRINDMSDFMKERKQTEIRFVMMFDDSSLLQTIYCRLVAALLGKWPVVYLPTSPHTQRLLFENLGVFRLYVNQAGVAEVRTNTIELLTFSLCPSTGVNSAVADKFRRFCEAVIQHEFVHLRGSTDKVEKPYIQTFRCNNKVHGVQGSKAVEDVKELRGNEDVPCPDLINHEMYSENAVSEWFSKEDIKCKDQNKDLTEKELSKIAQAIGKNWQLLGPELGLTQVDIDHIIGDNNTTVMKIYDMLTKWKRQNYGNSSMSVLMETLKNSRSLTVDWDIIRNICDDKH